MTEGKFRCLGFIGAGVMGGPMCRNLAARAGLPVIAMDRAPEALAALGAKVTTATAVDDVAASADLIFLSLPDSGAVAAVAAALLARPGRLKVLVDTSTTPVALTRDIASRAAAAGVGYADAPIARTRAAAEAGTLSVMVGAELEVFKAIRPLLHCFASDITHCGAVGAGQIVKILNNMVLFQTVGALAEALTLARRAGLDGETLLATLAKGSADSFALRNHAMKSMLPGDFPERAFSARYAEKDNDCARSLGAEFGITLDGAELTAKRLAQAIAAGDGDRYFPTILNVIARHADDQQISD